MLKRICIALLIWVLSLTVFSGMVGFSSVAQAQNVKTYIPKNAPLYLPIVKTEAQSIFPELVHPEYFAGLIEQESCISLTHSRCWKATSELKTAREQGSGLGQITRAYNKDGTVRFDSLADLRRRHMSQLKDLSWENVVQRPDLQIASIMLMSKDNYNGFFQIKDELNRLKMTDSAYNAGPGSVKKRRLQCGLTKGCDPQIWDGNVGLIKVLSQKPIYGTRSPQGINDEHVDYVFNIRMNKYIPYTRSVLQPETK